MNLAKLAISRPVFVVMIVLSILTLGIIGYNNLAIDLLPKIEPPNIIVMASYPGASATEMETLFAKPLENALATVSGLDNISSSSSEGRTRVMLAFKLDVDIKFAELSVREKVQEAQGRLPSDADAPTIRRFSTDDIPIMFFSLIGDRAPGDLRDILEQSIRPNIEGLPGVGSLNVSGSRQKQLRITLDRAILSANGINYNQVIAAIQKRNVSIPVGTVTSADKIITVRINGKANNSDDIRNITLTSASGKLLRIQDVANVQETLEDINSIARVNGQPALLFSIVKQSGENTLTIAKAVRTAVDNINTKLPAGLKINVISDSSVSIQRSISGVQSDILLGIVLAIFIVWLFLGNFRSTIITAIALPNSLLGTFFLIQIAGFSINTITLMGLSLAVGLLIDDSIVVRENIFRHIEEGEDPKTAAENGTNEVALAVLSTTLSIMAVFIPISFMSGIAGKFFKEFGLTIAFALLISLLDAFTSAPMLSAYWYSDSSKTKSKIGQFLNKLSGKWDLLYKQVNQFYTRVLEWCLDNKKKVLLTVAALFILSVGAMQFVGQNFVSPSDGGAFSINMATYPGAPMDKIDAFTIEVEKFLAQQKGIDSYFATVGEGASHRSQITVNMVALKQRKISTSAMLARTRQFMTGRFSKELTFNLSEANAISFGGGGGPGGGGGGNRIVVNLTGASFDQMDKISRDVINVMSAVPGLVDVQSSLQAGTPEMVIQLDPVKTEKAGITAADLGNSLRGLIQGSTISTVSLNDNDYNIFLQLDEKELKTREDIKNMLVTTKSGAKIPLTALGTIVYSSSPLTISRDTKQREISVSGTLMPGYAFNDASVAVKKAIDENVQIPLGYTWSFGGNQGNFRDLGSQMMFAMLLAVLFMFMILASLYNSFIQPLYIMVSLPLAFIGSFFGFFFTGVSLDIYGYIGLIMVTGLVAKNAILLLDFTNKKRVEGLNIRKSLLAAAPVRLRPILMTSFAIIFGMFPMVLGLNEGSSGRQALPIAVIGGILTSTFLTLVVVPIVYEWAEGLAEKVTKGKG